MYEAHFGLSKNPFQSIAEGEAVFEGPKQRKIIVGLKTALAANDAVAVVTGPVGVGKTTIVQRALEEAAPERLVARLGRTAVGTDELVDLLLAQFGVVREPTRRFECLKTFNRILNERAASGARVFIVIEDAERLGPDLLEELEALTATDDGSCAGANIVMMGPQKLDKLIARPDLERLRQRIRLQKTLDRFNAEEVEVYLRHRIAAAGGDYDAIFEKGTAMMVRRCSGGIPRVINGLCETALNFAAENTMTQVTAKIVFKVAVEVFGMAPGETPAAQAATPAPRPAAVAKAKAPTPKPAAAAKKPEPPAQKPPAAAQAPKPPAPTPAPATDRLADPTVPVAKVPSAVVSRPPAPAAPRAPKPPAKPGAAAPATNGATAPAATAEPPPSRLPDLSGLGVQDTAVPDAKTRPAAAKPLPDLPPKFKFADEIVVDKDTKPKLPDKPRKLDPPALPTLKIDDGKAKVADKKASTDNIPTLGDSARVQAVAPEKVPPASPKPAAAKAEPAISLEEPSPPAVRSEAQVDEGTASFAKVDHDMLDAALASLAVHDEEDGPPAEALALHKPAEEAPQPEPVDAPEVTLDKNIEAVRPGPDPEELGRMAAELESTKTLADMSDKLAETLFGSEELEAISMQIRDEVVAEENPVALESTEATGSAPSPEPAEASAPPMAPESPAVPTAQATAQIDTTGEQPVATPQPAPNVTASQPEPIENQINTSMTATLKTLNNHSKPPVDDDEPEETSSGLLGRLKNTFKS